MAVREREQTARNGGGKDAVARGLGWFSLALGTAQLAAPRGVARLIGVKDDGEHGAVMRAVGVREIATGVGILARRRPVGWLWARVAGDALDLALLAKARSKRRNRVTAAMAAVAGVAVPDVIESARLSRASAGEDIHVRKAITLNRPAQEVYAFWRDFANFSRFMAHVESVRVTADTLSHWVATAPGGKTVEWDAEIVDDRPGELIAWRSLPGADVENSGSVLIKPMPARRATELEVELRYSPPGGSLGATVAKLFGEDPATQMADDLRRFKQVLETGEVVVSEGSPAGHAFAQHLKQRPARPLSEEESR